jgi:hypothetical protein
MTDRSRPARVPSRPERVVRRLVQAIVAPGETTPGTVRTRPALARVQAAAAQAHGIVFGLPCYCHCKVPRPDWTHDDLLSSEPWCWTCKLPLDETTLLDRVVAFIG